jgi:hypothetical protein
MVDPFSIFSRYHKKFCFCFSFYLQTTHTNTKINTELSLHIRKKELDGLNLLPNHILFRADACENLLTIRIVKKDAALGIHLLNEVALVLHAEESQIILDALIIRLIHDVTVTRGRKREGDGVKVGGREARDRHVKRYATVPLSPTALGKEVCPSSILFGARNLRRRRRRKKEAGIGLPCVHLSSIDEFCVNLSRGVIEVAARCTEAGGISRSDGRVRGTHESCDAIPLTLALIRSERPGAVIENLLGSNGSHLCCGRGY